MENGMGLSASDVALLNRDSGFGFDGGGAFMWIFALLILAGGGFGGFGNNFANAIGYENLATASEVQRGFDNQNQTANQREILSAVNQTFHDTLGIVQDKYGELAHDIAALAVSQANTLANQNACCGEIKMLISETAAQNRYDSAMNTQKVLDVLAQNKIESLQAQVNALELQAATSNVVRYPNSWTYNAGASPFCGCGNNYCGC